MNVLVESPPFPLEVAREIVGPAGAEVVQVGRRVPDDHQAVAYLGWSRMTAADMDRLPALRVIATPSVGFDHVDIAAASERGVWVCNVPDYCIDEMADTTIALLLALLRGTVALDRAVRDGRWDEHAAGALRRIKDVRLGVIGFGRIGRAVAGRAIALGMQVWATDPAVSEADVVAAGARAATLDELLRECNAITLHVPLVDATTRMLGRRELALLPRGAFVVNTARAALIDPAALLDALASGALAGVALDVLEVEPPDAAHPAPAHPNLIVTPHAAWYSPESEREVYRRAASSVLDVLEGREPGGAVAAPRRSRARLKGVQKSDPRT